MKFTHQYLKEHYKHTYQRFRNSPYYDAPEPLFKRLTTFLDLQDFYFITPPILDDKKGCAGTCLEMKVKNTIVHVTNTKDKDNIRVEKTYFGTLLNEYEKFLAFN